MGKTNGHYTEAQAYEAYRAAAGLTKAEQAEVLGISKQRLNNYYKGTQADKMTVLDWFLRGKADWVREMALDIFKLRDELDVPCVCLERIGDNGPCPRHAAVLVEEA